MKGKLVLLLVLIISPTYLMCMGFNIPTAKASNAYHIHNLNTGLNYTTIQEAIDANETWDGHTIFVEEGIYYEHVFINKSVSLIGENPQNTTIDVSDAYGYAVIIDADGVNVTGFTIRDGYAGIRLEGASHCNIFGNNITANTIAIEVILSSSNNNVYGNNITANEGGIAIEWSTDNNSVVGNNIATNNVGVFLAYARNNSIVGNNITNNGADSVYLGSYSYYNSVFGNNITNNKIGIGFGSYANDNSVVGNNIVNNGLGVRISPLSSGNMFYHNNFIGNTQQSNSSWGSPNVWDDGYPSGGNYWSDYNGIDLNEDGIGDTSYVINEENKDNYPLMVPYITAAQMRVLYYALLEKFNELLARYNLLNQTCEGLLGNITNLQEQVDSLNSTCIILQTSIGSWQQQVDLLNSTLQISIDELQSQIDSLNSTSISGQKAIVDELANIRNLVYVFIATTLILIATTVYFAKRKPKKEP